MTDYISPLLLLRCGWTLGQVVELVAADYNVYSVYIVCHV